LPPMFSANNDGPKAECIADPSVRGNRVKCAAFVLRAANAVAMRQADDMMLRDMPTHSPGARVQARQVCGMQRSMVVLR